MEKGMGGDKMIKPLAGLRVSILVSCFLVVMVRPSRAEGIPTAQEAELHVKIQSKIATGELELYKVELCKTTGEIVRIVSSPAGETVHFKRLKPDIYMVCLEMPRGNKQCKSIDLYPPHESKNHIFAMEILPPTAVFHSSELNAVTVEQLQTPEKAKKELLNSIKAELHGNPQEVIAHLQRAIEIDPSYVAALNNLASCYYLNGNKELSIQYFEKAAELDSHFHAAWSNLASVLISANRWEDALKPILHGLALWPDCATSNLQAAAYYLHKQNYSEAEKYLKTALELDPASGSFPMLDLARIALMSNRTEEGKDHIRLFLKLHPNYPNVSYWTGILRNLDSGHEKEPQTAAANKR
jgi:Tfp pilus assembly protein PilF